MSTERKLANYELKIIGKNRSWPILFQNLPGVIEEIIWKELGPGKEPEPFMKRSTEHGGPEDSIAGAAYSRRRNFHSWPGSRHEEVLHSFTQFLEKNVAY
jgi:hypothetical protein